MPGERIAGRASRTRYLILLVIFVVTTISYADRATLSLAGPAASKQLGLDAITMGWVLSAFAIAYVIAQIPGGLLLDRFGSKPVYVAALALWSVFTALQGFVGLVTGAAAAALLFGLRFAMGVAEAPAFPANARLVAAWFPAGERGFASAVFNAAQYFSLVVFAPLMGWLVHDFGWPSVFWVMGALGVASAAVLAWTVRAPRRHPLVNAEELALLTEGGALVDVDAGPPVGPSAFTWHNIRQVLTSRMLLGVYLGQYCINVLTYFFATWFPIYLVQQRHFTILAAGFVSAIPAICGFLGGLGGGLVSDALLRRTGSPTIARKAPLLVGMVLAGAIVLANYVAASWQVIAVMALAFFGKGIASLGWAVVADTSPRALLGVTGGIFNMAGNTAGIVTPVAIGYIVGRTGSFDGALLFVGAHCLVTIFAYFVITGRIERLELAPARPVAGAAA